MADPVDTATIIQLMREGRAMGVRTLKVGEGPTAITLEFEPAAQARMAREVARAGEADLLADLVAQEARQMEAEEAAAAEQETAGS